MSKNNPDTGTAEALGLVTFRAFLPGVVAAWSMRVSALVSFAVTPAGMV